MGSRHDLHQTGEMTCRSQSLRALFPLRTRFLKVSEGLQKIIYPGRRWKRLNCVLNSIYLPANFKSDTLCSAAVADRMNIISPP